MVELSRQPSYEDTYAWVFYQMKDYQNALVWIEKAISSGGNTSSTIVEHYGEMFVLNFLEKRRHYNNGKMLKN